MHSDIKAVITNEGLDLSGRGDNQVELNITRMKISSKSFDPDPSMADLEDVFFEVGVLDYKRSGGILTVNFLWDGESSGEAGSLGFYSGEKLFSIISKKNTVLFSKSPGDARVVPYDIRFERAVMDRIKVDGVPVDTTMSVAAELVRIADAQAEIMREILDLKGRLRTLEIKENI